MTNSFLPIHERTRTSTKLCWCNFVGVRGPYLFGLYLFELSKPEREATQTAIHFLKLCHLDGNGFVA